MGRPFYLAMCFTWIPTALLANAKPLTWIYATVRNRFLPDDPLLTRKFCAISAQITKK